MAEIAAQAEPPEGDIGLELDGDLGDLSLEAEMADVALGRVSGIPTRADRSQASPSRASLDAPPAAHSSANVRETDADTYVDVDLDLGDLGAALANDADIGLGIASPLSTRAPLARLDLRSPPLPSPRARASVSSPSPAPRLFSPRLARASSSSSAPSMPHSPRTLTSPRSPALHSPSPMPPLSAGLGSPHGPGSPYGPRSPRELTPNGVGSPGFRFGPSPLASRPGSPAASPTPPPRSPSPYRPSDLLPQPRFLPAPVLRDPADADGDASDDAAADAAPFESIPLDAVTPPASPGAVPVPLSPVAALALAPGSPSPHPKRASYSGFGMTRDGERIAHGVLPDPFVRSPENHAAPAGAAPRRSSEATPPADVGSSTPRRAAPPAHPHPFPLPSSPRASTSRLSTSSGATPASPTASVHGVPPASAQPPGAPGPTHTHTPALGVKGAATLDRFVSQTRPSHLPPKDKGEDEAHKHQWEEIMAQSRAAEAERRRHVESRRLEREKRLAVSTPKWEALLADPAFSADKVRGDKELRAMWFEGVPSHLRGKAWAVAIGNPLTLHKHAYKSYAARAKKALDAGRFPPDVLEQMEHEFDDTLVTLHIFQRGSPVRDELRDLVCAWMAYRADQGLGYAPYVNLLAAMFLLVSPPEIAFLSLVNFLARPVLRAFYTDTADEIAAFYRVFEELQADKFPIIFANCKNLGLRLPESYFRSVLVDQVPFEAVCRLWDQIVLDGDGFIFRAALAIFGFLEPRLYFPDRDEILSTLEGRNAATIAITRRERERARLRGEPYLDALDGKLSVFGLHETALFDWLEHDGWTEKRFERLMAREMPD